MNKVRGYRSMLGLSQKEMGERLGISEGTYRNKEKGYSIFNKKEMEKFAILLKEKNISIQIEAIFF